MKSTFDDAMLAASFGRSQGQVSELSNHVRGLGQPSSAGLSPEQKDRRLRDACEGFESIFIQKMWQQMRATLPQEGLLRGRDEAYWQDMYDQELAKSMASAGGIGLANMMYEQLSRNLVSASRSTASASRPVRSAFSAEAAPLLPASSEAPVAVAEGKSPVAGSGVTASIYEGIAPQEGLVPQAVQQQAQAAQANPAAAAPAATAVPATPAAPVAQNAPEVEQALALLRSRQTAEPVQAATDTRKNRGRSRRSSQLTGLQMAQQAQREAGDKLGNGVRPAPFERRASRQAPPSAGQLAAANANASQAPQGAAQTPQPQSKVRRVRYSTNLPPQKRQTDKEDLIRVLNMDSPQPRINDSAGIAAYQQAAAAQGNPAMPNSRAQAVRDSAALRQMMEAREGGQASTPVVTTGPLAPLTGA